MAVAKKKPQGSIILQIPAGAAVPGRPIGPALGACGLNIALFCKEFNAQTQELTKGELTVVVITYYADKSFTFELRGQPTSVLIKRAAGLDTKPKPGSGSPTPGRKFVGKITSTQARDIALLKMQYMNAFDVEAAVRMIEGSARSMGIEVVSV